MGRIRLPEPPKRPKGVDDDAVLSVFRVPDDCGGMRLDQYLRSELRRTSRSRAHAIIRASAHDLEGRKLRPGSRVRPGALIVLWRPPWDETVVPTEIPIVYEDEHLFAVNKPPHLPVHPTTRYNKNTLIKLLEMQRPGQWLSLGHRLDRETSGVLLVSKSLDCDRAFKRAVENREDIEKRYVALTWGIPRGAEVGVSLRHREALKLDERARIKVKMRTADDDETGALASSTVFTVQSTSVHPINRKMYAMVHCDLETGRQHQIRVHLQSLGAPIVGDKLYGPDELCFARSADGVLTEDDLEMLELPRHALHAERLALPHPITGAPLEIHAPLTRDMQDFWRECAGID